MQFIQKHWKGEYPLWRSFWINFILVDFILVIVFSFLLASSLPNKEMAIRLILNYAIIAVFIAVWQTVGVYRSAEKSGKKFWAPLAQLFTIACLVRTIMSLATLLFSQDTSLPALDMQIEEILKVRNEVIQQQSTESSKEINASDESSANPTIEPIETVPTTGTSGTENITR